MLHICGSGGGRGYSVDFWRARCWGGGAGTERACLRPLAPGFPQLPLLVVGTGYWVVDLVVRFPPGRGRPLLGEEALIARDAG